MGDGRSLESGRLLDHLQYETIKQNKKLRPVLFVAQIMSNISKQDCTHNKQIPQCTKMRICILLQ